MPPPEALAILRRVAIEAPDRARVDGHEVVPAAGAAGDAPVLDALALAIYHACYAGMAWPFDPSAPPGRDLRPELDAANAGRDAWEPGWVYLRKDLEGRIVVQRDVNLRAWWPGHWVRADAVPGPLVAGTQLRAFHPAAPRAVVQEGFWFAHGHGGPDDERRRVRLYFNVAADGAAELTAALTKRLHALEVPFTLKVADREAYAVRRDSLVLWVETRHLRVVGLLARETAAALRTALGEEVPPFTRRLCDGVGLADDPAGGLSFGMERCGAVAEGVWLAWSEGAEGDDERLDALSRAFAERGLDLERPWLAAGTTVDRHGLAA
jgi:type III HopA1-like effector protein